MSRPSNGGKFDYVNMWTSSPYPGGLSVEMAKISEFHSYRFTGDSENYEIIYPVSFQVPNLQNIGN